MPTETSTTNLSDERKAPQNASFDAPFPLPDLKPLPLNQLDALYDGAAMMDAALLGIHNQPRMDRPGTYVTNRYSYQVHCLQDAIAAEAMERDHLDQDDAETRATILIR